MDADVHASQYYVITYLADSYNLKKRASPPLHQTYTPPFLIEVFIHLAHYFEP